MNKREKCYQTSMSKIEQNKINKKETKYSKVERKPTMAQQAQPNAVTYCCLQVATEFPAALAVVAAYTAQNKRSKENKQKQKKRKCNNALMSSTDAITSYCFQVPTECP